MFRCVDPRLEFANQLRARQGLRKTWLVVSLATGAVMAAGCAKSSVPASQAPGSKQEPGAQVPQSADEVLKRYVQALGGEEKLRKINARTMEAKIVFLASKNCKAEDDSCLSQDMSGQYVRYATADGKTMRRVVMGSRVEERGFDGKTGWQVQTDPPALVLDDAEAAPALREDGLLHWYLDYQSRGITPRLEKPRETDFAGRSRLLDGVIWADAKGILPVRTLWFDRQTGLFHAETEVSGQGPQALLQTTVYEGYRAVDGVLIPHLIRELTQLNDQSSEVELRVSTVVHTPIRPQVFAIPPVPTVEPQPDHWLDALNKARADAKANEKDAVLQVAYARKAFDAAHFDEAVGAARKTLAVDPKEPEALWIVARIAVMRGQGSEAERALDQAAKAGVNPAQVSFQRALLAVEAGSYVNAAKAYEGAGVGPYADRFAALGRAPLKIDGPCEVTLPTLLPQVPIFEGKSDDQALRIAVDTSAGELVMGKSLAQKLSVQIDGEAPLILGGPTATYGSLASLKVGDLTLRNVPVTVVTDEAVLAMAGIAGVDAIWGARLLMNWQFTFDLPNNRLILVQQQKKCNGALKVRRSGLAFATWLQDARYIYTTAAISGSEGVYMINTGMRGAAVTANVAAFSRAGVAPPPMRRGAAPLLRLENFTLVGERALNYTQVPALYGTLQDETTIEGHRFDGLIGVDLIAPRRVTFDLEKRMMYVDPAANKPAPVPAAAPAAGGAAPSAVGPATPSSTGSATPGSATPGSATPGSATPGSATSGSQSAAPPPAASSATAPEKTPPSPTPPAKKP